MANLFERPERLKRADTARTIHLKKDLQKSPYLAALDKLPRFLRYGPWSPAMYVFLILFVVTMIYEWQFAYNEFPITNTNSFTFWSGIWRLLLSFYGFGLVTVICFFYSWWPLTSFTLMSWNLFTVRYFFSSLVSFGFDNKIFYVICELLRFPSLVCNSITVSIWWLLLFPIILFSIKSKKAQQTFIAFNKTPFLLNVHLLNLPFAALDHLLNVRLLTFFDLWMGIFIAMVYVLIYLFIMDPMGLHFYHIILSPRPHWCIITYLVILSLFPLNIWLWNQIALWLNLI